MRKHYLVIVSEGERATLAERITVGKSRAGDLTHARIKLTHLYPATKG